MIGGVETPRPRRGVAWAFWITSALAAAGGILPVLLAGTSGRISTVIIPFWVAAIAFAASAVFQHLGKGPATVLYLAAGLATVYGLLEMFAVLIQLAVLNTCPQTGCAPGATRPLSSAELSGIGYAMGMGTVALVIGFAGLMNVYRRRRAQPHAFTPPVRTIAPFTPAQTDGAEARTSSVADTDRTETPAEQAATSDTELAADPDAASAETRAEA